MLDDPKYIARFDRSEGFAMVAGQPQQLRHDYQIKPPVIDNSIHNLVLVGMGGSALAAEFIRSWLSDGLKVPFEIVRDYELPLYVNEHSLVIVSSYSGNTEETLSCLKQVGESGATAVRMTAGGKLAQDDSVEAMITIPNDLQPRFAVLYEAKAIAVLLEELKLVEGVVEDLEVAADWLLEEVTHFAPNIPEADNIAKQIAKQLVGHPVVIYGGPTLAMPAMKWKIDLNENAKNLAFWNQLPEFNHNEFIGWSNPKNSLMKVVQLHSSLDNDRVKKRFEVSNRLLSGSMPAPVVVEAQGQTKLQQMLWSMLLGDFVATYVAMLNQVDPVPVELIEKLKKELG